ncbi:MAG: hypothetical protein U1F49_01485 [Rubrivivax sp.]
MRRLEEHDRHLVGQALAQPRVPLGATGRQEAGEAETTPDVSPATLTAASALLAGRRHHRDGPPRPRGDEHRAGVETPGVPASLTSAVSPRARRSSTAALAPCSLCACSATRQLAGDAEVRQQRAADACPRRPPRHDARQHVQRTQRDVGEVADRRGDDVECAGLEALVARRRVRGVQQQGGVDGGARAQRAFLAASLAECSGEDACTEEGGR